MPMHTASGSVEITEAGTRGSVPAEPATADPATAPEPLAAAILLSGIAGLLDSVTYLLHGHIFATAMTGNTALLGLTILAGDYGTMLLHAAPLIGYVLGVLVSRALRLWLGAVASPVALAFEAVALIGAGFAPQRLSAVLFAGGIAFVSAVQVAGFRQVGPYPYNSTFLTGDLRELGDELLGWLWPGDTGTDRRFARGRFRDLTLVFVGFLAGATAGAVGAHFWASRVYWLPVPVLLALAPLSLRWAQQRTAAIQRATSTQHNKAGGGVI